MILKAGDDFLSGATNVSSNIDNVDEQRDGIQHHQHADPQPEKIVRRQALEPGPQKIQQRNPKHVPGAHKANR